MHYRTKPLTRGYLYAAEPDRSGFTEDDELVPIATLCRQILGCTKEAVTIAHYRGRGITGHVLPATLHRGVWCTTEAAFLIFADATNIRRSPTPCMPPRSPGRSSTPPRPTRATGRCAPPGAPHGMTTIGTPPPPRNGD